MGIRAGSSFDFRLRVNVRDSFFKDHLFVWQGEKKRMSIAVPLIICLILIACIAKRVDILSEFTKGARENLLVAFELCPTLILLMTAVSMFSASGASEALCDALSPAAEFLGFPKECLPLLLLRPISGSGSLAALEDIMTSNGADSPAGIIGCVMMSATETTLYTIAVYYSAVRKKPPAKVFASSLSADMAGFVFASLFAKLLIIR